MTMPTTMRGPGRTSKRIHHACLQNLDMYLKGELTFAEWRSRQEELESRLSPEPELPFSGEEENQDPDHPKAA